MSRNFSTPGLQRPMIALLIIGVVLLAITLPGAFANRRQFYFSYLFGCVFWVGVSLGCLSVLLIHVLTGGRWGYPTRRIFEAGAMVLPLMAILFIPVFLGLSQMYPWADPAHADNELVRHRHAYENNFGYILRSVCFFVLMIVLASRLRTFSLAQDTTNEAEPTRQARALSGPGIVFYALAGTFIYVDWIMSLEANWHSTLFGLILLIAQVLQAFCFGIVMMERLKNQESIIRTVTHSHAHQLGNLLLTFVLFWTYISFGQLLIIYSGDLPHEIDWYRHRIAGSWQWVIVVIAIFHFFVPFFLLLFRVIKRNRTPLAAIAGMLFVMQLLDTYWLIMPVLHPEGVRVSWMDVTAPTGIGALWLSYFLYKLRSAPLLPQQDPGLQFSYGYGH